LQVNRNRSQISVCRALECPRFEGSSGQRRWQSEALARQIGLSGERRRFVHGHVARLYAVLGPGRCLLLRIVTRGDPDALGGLGTVAWLDPPEEEP
jgi:hypothetical protein